MQRLRRHRLFAVIHGDGDDRQENKFALPAGFQGRGEKALDGGFKGEKAGGQISRLRRFFRRGRIYGCFQFPAPSICSIEWG